LTIGLLNDWYLILYTNGAKLKILSALLNQSEKVDFVLDILKISNQNQSEPPWTV